MKLFTDAFLLKSQLKKFNYVLISLSICLFVFATVQDKLGEQIKHILRPAASREDLTLSFSSGSYFSWKL